MSTKEIARGKWQSIIPIVTGISPKMLDGKHRPCPVTGEGDNRFRFSNRDGRGNFFCACNPDGKGDGFDLIQCARGLTFKEAAQEVERSIGVAQEDRHKARRTEAQIVADLKAVARSFVTPDHVTSYLASRGLRRPSTLRQARTRYGLPDQNETLDAMAAVISAPNGDPVSMHLTYLVGGKKAPFDPNRIVMTPKGTIKGGAVRLHPLENTNCGAVELVIAEGIESALAAGLLTGNSAWAVISANGMREFEPPPEVDRLRIFADADDNYTGQAAAFHLANRLKIKRPDMMVEVYVPCNKGMDANDILAFNEKTGLYSDTRIC